MAERSEIRLVSKVAAIQMCSGPDKALNLCEARRLLELAMVEKPCFVAFPENFSLFADTREAQIAGAESTDSPTAQVLASWAKEHSIWLLAGGIPLKIKGDPNRLTNTSLLFGPNGKLAARYDKMHLFDAKLAADRAYKESQTFCYGSEAVTVSTSWAVLGLTICYDIRFPELYRKLSSQGAQVLLIPSAFTAHTGQAHWDVLTRARAIENQAFVIAPAQCGSPYPGRKTHGHSRIIDVWGRVLAEKTTDPGVICTELDFSQLEKVRSEMPVLSHRRL